MYVVKICIYTDGDFGYDEPEFNARNDEVRKFYFENRNNAAVSLAKSIHNLKSSFRSSKRCNHVKEFLDFLDEKIDLIIKKIPEFYIHQYLGNQELTFALLKVDKEERENGCFSYVENYPYLDFSWYDIENDVNWDALETIEDVL